jgi:hypothetical protein
MFGQNIMKPVSREDIKQLEQAHKFLVPLSVFRKQRELAPILPENNEDKQAEQVRKLEKEQEQNMSNDLIKNTLKDLIKKHRNGK